MTDGLWLTANAERKADSTHPIQQPPKDGLRGCEEDHIVVLDFILAPLLARTRTAPEGALRIRPREFTTCSDGISTKPTQSDHSRT